VGKGEKERNSAIETLLIGHVGRGGGRPGEERLQALAEVKKRTGKHCADALEYQEARARINISIRTLFQTKAERKKKSCGDSDILQPKRHEFLSNTHEIKTSLREVSKLDEYQMNLVVATLSLSASGSGIQWKSSFKADTFSQ
jgi:hypothetical protein